MLWSRSFTQRRMQGKWRDARLSHKLLRTWAMVDPLTLRICAQKVQGGWQLPFGAVSGSIPCVLVLPLLIYPLLGQCVKIVLIYCFGFLVETTVLIFQNMLITMIMTIIKFSFTEGS